MCQKHMGRLCMLPHALMTEVVTELRTRNTWKPSILIGTFQVLDHPLEIMNARDHSNRKWFSHIHLLDK